MATDTMSSQNEPSRERRYHDTNAAYALPNDNTEHERLETQAKLIHDMMNGQVIHAPLTASAVHKALDIGCGTGIATDHIASQFPDAKVYGLDLSPVPNVRQKLTNIEYVQANFSDLTGANQPGMRFKKGSFDYVFSRLLVVGMTNWKDYVERCVALAKPGGWIEMQDLDISFYRAPNPLSAAQRGGLNPQSMTLSEFRNEPRPEDIWCGSGDWVTTLQKICAAQDMDATCGKQLPEIFFNAGLLDVHIKRFTIPTSPWEGLTESEKEFGVFYRDSMGRQMSQLIRKLAEGQDVISQEDVDKACEEAQRETAGWRETRAFVFYYVVCGRKP